MKDGMENSIEIRAQWEDVFRRLQQASRQNSGVVMIQLRLFAKDGKPIFWVAPEVISLEPRLRITPDVLLNEMTEEQMKGILQTLFS